MVRSVSCRRRWGCAVAHARPGLKYKLFYTDCGEPVSSDIDSFIQRVWKWVWDTELGELVGDSLLVLFTVIYALGFQHGPETLWVTRVRSLEITSRALTRGAVCGGGIPVQGGLHN